MLLRLVRNMRIHHYSSTKLSRFPQSPHSRNYHNKHQKVFDQPSKGILITSIASLTLLNIVIAGKERISKTLFPKVEAESRDEDAETEEESIENVKEYQKMKGRESIAGFRMRKIVEYENRIRQYSTPDKVFRYFATIQLVDETGGSEVFMTPNDFLRSLIPGIKQPENLCLDRFKKYDRESIKRKIQDIIAVDSIFKKIGTSGLISFSDYLFLLTVLSTSKKHFEVAFRMFDLKGDGDVDYEEFEKVTSIIIQQTTTGSRHRDHSTTGNTFKGLNTTITEYFFGPNKDHKLTIEKFLQFQERVQKEILKLEFIRKEPDEHGRISEVNFGELILAYAGYVDVKKVRILKKVKRDYKEDSQGISLKEYLNFYKFLSNINDVDTALTFYHIAGASIDKKTFQHVARTVSEIELTEHMVDVIFSIFDDNNDGQLSNKEFIAVMKNRLLRGLEKPKDMGFIRLMWSIAKCAAELRPNTFGK